MNIRIPSDIIEKIQRIAKEKNVKYQDVYLNAIIEYVDNYFAQVCQACKFVNQPGSKFCSNCGHPLNPEGLEELIKAREYLKKNPRILLENYQALISQNKE